MEGRPSTHRHKDVYQHSLTVLRQADRRWSRGTGLTATLRSRLGAAPLLHDIGKPKDQDPAAGRAWSPSTCHEVKGASMTKRRLTRAALSRKT